MTATGPGIYITHRGMPLQGTPRSTGGENAGSPADLMNRAHYPLEAVCESGQVIALKRLMQGRMVTQRKKAGRPGQRGREIMTGFGKRAAGTAGNAWAGVKYAGAAAGLCVFVMIAAPVEARRRRKMLEAQRRAGGGSGQ